MINRNRPKAPSILPEPWKPPTTFEERIIQSRKETKAYQQAVKNSKKWERLQEKLFGKNWVLIFSRKTHLDKPK